MLTMVEGKIGSGKSFYTIWDLLQKYYRYDEKLCQWFPAVDLELYTNIDRFTLGHDLVKEVKLHGGVNPFFTNEFQYEFTKLKKVIYVIDEVHSAFFFHKTYKDSKVMEFWAYTRHFGIDAYIMTQDVKKVSPELLSCVEHHVRAVARSFALSSKVLNYNFISDGDIYKRKAVKKDARVFNTYRSSFVQGSHKVPSFAGRLYVYVGLFLFVMVGGFYMMISGFKARASAGPVSNVAESSQVSESYKVVALMGDRVLLKRSGGGSVKVAVSEVVSDAGGVSVGSVVRLR